MAHDRHVPSLVCRHWTYSLEFSSVRALISPYAVSLCCSLWVPARAGCYIEAMATKSTRTSGVKHSLAANGSVAQGLSTTKLRPSPAASARMPYRIRISRAALSTQTKPPSPVLVQFRSEEVEPRVVATAARPQRRLFVLSDPHQNRASPGTPSRRARTPRLRASRRKPPTNRPQSGTTRRTREYFLLHPRHLHKPRHRAINLTPRPIPRPRSA